MTAKLLIAALLCLPPALSSAASPKAKKYSEGKYFTITIPAGWVKKEEGAGLSDGSKRVYGSEFFGPYIGKYGVMMSVHYYAPDNLVQPTYEKFIKLHSAPALGINMDGKRYGKVKSGKAGHYYAKVFDRRTYEYEPKNALHPKKIHIYEKFYVVPVKRGFYVLRYYAPMDLAKASLKSFEKSVASFKPLVR